MSDAKTDSKKEPVLHDPERFAVLAADVVLFTIHNRELLVRLMHVVRPPYFPDNAGFPGAILRGHETAEDTALRVIRERGLINSPIYMEQLCTMSRVNRDPRGRVVAVAYLAIVPWDSLSYSERADTDDAWWKPARSTKNLSYDHDEVLEIALKRLCSRVTYTTLIMKLMPKEFTLTELEQAYESILKTDLDKRNFRKKLLKLKLLTPLPRKKKGGKFRPAQLYSFSTSKVKYIEVI